MSKVLVNESSLSSIGNAIREKNGETTKYKPSEMGEAILAITTGSDGGDTLPDEAFMNYPSNAYRFYGNTWNWFLNKYKDRLHGLELSPSMFEQSTLLTTVPSLVIHDKSIQNAFEGCGNLTEVNISAKKDIYFPDYNGIVMDDLFSGCHRLRTISYNMFGDVEPAGTESRSAMFMSCYSLRELPNLLPINHSPSSHTRSLYWGLAGNCYTLNKIENLPVIKSTFTKNCFSTTISNNNRLKEFTFYTNNGDIEEVEWSNQVIDFTQYVGWCNAVTGNITDFNSGIVGCRVDDDADYSKYKNHPDWWTNDYRYSRYNKISAVNTINSLPDTSAYLASAGGTNTIKFLGDAGKLTDGGAINTLNDAEIAVATAKGWTVSFV